MTDADLGELLRRCEDPRDVAAWEEFVRTFRRPLALVVIRTMGVEDADDLVQEALLRLFTGRTRLRPVYEANGEAGVYAFVRAIGLNAVRDRARARSARKRDERVTGVLDEEQAGVGEDMERAVLLGQVSRAVGEVASERDREIFELYYRYGHSAEAIAGRTGDRLTPKGVESLLRRTVSALKERFTAPEARR